MGTQLRHLQTPQSSAALRRQPAADDLQEEHQRQDVVSRSPMGPGVVTALQRTHGNAHVQRVLAPPHGGQIQRDAAFDPADYRNDEVIDNALLGKERVPLFKLNDDRSGSNWTMRIGANTEARRVIHQFNGLEGVHEDWMDAMSILESHEGQGSAANTKVQKSSRAIGKRSTGQSGQYVHDRVQNYLESVSTASAQLRILGERQDDIDNALSHVQTIMLGKERKQQERVVKQGEDDVKEEEERVEKQKEFIKDALDLLGGLTDPTEWVKFTVDSAIFIGKQVVDEYLPSSKLDKLKKDLESAKKKLVTIEDAEIASQLVEAAGELKAKRNAFLNQKKTYLELFDNLRVRQKALIEALESSSSTREAAGAIKERGMVANSALTAEKLINQHRDLSIMLMQQIGKLETDYRTIHSLAGQTANKPPVVVEHFTVVPERNVENLQPLKNWVNNARAAADDDLAYIASGSFLSGYDAIPETLRNALLSRGSG